MAWGADRPKLSKEYYRNRARVLKRDNYTCQMRLHGVCIEKATEVDHIINREAGGDDSMGNLRAVCVPCHKKKTYQESRVAYRRRKRDASHSWTRTRHPGLIADFARNLGRLVWSASLRGRVAPGCVNCP